MAKNTTPPSAKVREDLRRKIISRIPWHRWTLRAVSKTLGLSIAQASRLKNGHDTFSLDRLVDVAKRAGINSVRIAI